MHNASANRLRIAVGFSIWLSLMVAYPIGPAMAGPCAVEIARLEAALDALGSSTNATVVHQSLRAQMHRQPTPNLVARGKLQAVVDERHHRAALQRARAADAAHNEQECLKALPDLRHELTVR